LTACSNARSAPDDTWRRGGSGVGGGVTIKGSLTLRRGFTSAFDLPAGAAVRARFFDASPDFAPFPAVSLGFFVTIFFGAVFFATVFLSAVFPATLFFKFDFFCSAFFGAIFLDGVFAFTRLLEADLGLVVFPDCFAVFFDDVLTARTAFLTETDFLTLPVDLLPAFAVDFLFDFDADPDALAEETFFFFSSFFAFEADVDRPLAAATFCEVLLF
jgi:hypothetical protein